MIGTYGYLVVQVEVYPCYGIVEGSGKGSKYIVALEFVPEVINCTIFLVVVVVLALIVVLVLRFCVVIPPTPSTDCYSSYSMGSV